jgi:hypothetical protein
MSNSDNLNWLNNLTNNEIEGIVAAANNKRNNYANLFTNNDIEMILALGEALEKNRRPMGRLNSNSNSNSNSNNNNNRRVSVRALMNSNSNNNVNNSNRKFFKGDKSMKITRKKYGKTGTAETKGRYRSSTSCTRLPVSAVQKWARDGGLSINKRRNGRKGPQSSSRPSLCRNMYGFKELFNVARHLGITKTKKYKQGRRYKTVEEIEKEIASVRNVRGIPKNYTYKQILNSGKFKGKFKERGRRV